MMSNLITTRIAPELNTVFDDNLRCLRIEEFTVVLKFTVTASHSFK